MVSFIKIEGDESIYHPHFLMDKHISESFIEIKSAEDDSI